MFVWFLFRSSLFGQTRGQGGSASKRRCWASWWSVACAGDKRSSEAAGPGSWSHGTAWLLVGGTWWPWSPPPSWSGLSGHGHSVRPQVSEALGHRAWGRQVPVLPVHVVGPTAGVTAQPDTKFWTPRGVFRTPAHSRQFPLKISSCSAAETQSATSGTWQWHG